MNADDPPEDVVNAVIASPVTRLPLWRGNPENIVGILHVKDLLRALHAVDGDAAKVDIAALMTPPWFVPDTRPVSEQLKAFRRRKTPFALVVDEYGEVEGLVTLEDILEEIVGDITDEHDVAMPGVRRQPDGSVNVDGAVPIRDLNRVMDWNLPDEEATTIAGLVIHEARSIPEVGPELHLPRLPLPGAAPRAQSHHRAAHPAAAAQAGGEDGVRPHHTCDLTSSSLGRGRDGLCGFARRRGVDGERMHAAGEFIRKNPVNHAMAFDPGLSFERLRHDIDPEMSLPARPVPGMAFVLVRFVHHLEALRRESLGQLLCDEIGGAHACPDYERAGVQVNGCVAARFEDAAPLSSLEGDHRQRRIVFGHEIRLAAFRSHPRQAGQGSPAENRRAGLRMGGLQGKGAPIARPRGATTRRTTGASASSTCANTISRTISSPA